MSQNRTYATSLAEARTYSRRNTHLKWVNWTITAPTRDPPAAPTGDMAPKKAKPTFLLLPGGMLIPIRAMIFGTIKPPPMPHKALVVHIMMILSEKPPHSAQMTHQTEPRMRIFLWP